jgi:hypothetical protein
MDEHQLATGTASKPRGADTEVKRFMKAAFWIVGGSAVLLTGYLFCVVELGYFDDGMLVTPIEELDTAHPARGSVFYKSAAKDLADYLQAHGFAQIAERPRVGRYWPPIMNQRDAWFQRTDGTRIWVRILQADAWKGKINTWKEPNNWVMVEHHLDAGMSAWVVWPPRAWNIVSLENQAHALESDLKRWWRDYLAAHPRRAL